MGEFIASLAIVFIILWIIIWLKISEFYYEDTICVMEHGTWAIYSDWECFLPSKK